MRLSGTPDGSVAVLHNTDVCTGMIDGVVECAGETVYHGNRSGSCRRIDWRSGGAGEENMVGDPEAGRPGQELQVCSRWTA